MRMELDFRFILFRLRWILVFEVIFFWFFLFLFGGDVWEERGELFVIIGGPRSEGSGGGSVIVRFEHG